mmetsp:Transcript_849/g.2918  ORF Transcript_849/g.2918 Transcript_849/m.2918 type:complete len:205 (-) Transcript_849:289-903(-)
MKCSPSPRRSERHGLKTSLKSFLSAAAKTEPASPSRPAQNASERGAPRGSPAAAGSPVHTACSKSNWSRLRSTPCRLGTSRRALRPSSPGWVTSMPCICLASLPALVPGRVGMAPMGAAPLMAMLGSPMEGRAAGAPGTASTAASGGGAPRPCMEATSMPMERTSLMLRAGMTARATAGTAFRPGRLVVAAASLNLSRPNLTPP